MLLVQNAIVAFKISDVHHFFDDPDYGQVQVSAVIEQKCLHTKEIKRWTYDRTKWIGCSPIESSKVNRFFVKATMRTGTYILRKSSTRELDAHRQRKLERRTHLQLVVSHSPFLVECPSFEQPNKMLTVLL